jgi:rhodanese-related sulfurtransferase
MNKIDAIYATYPQVTVIRGDVAYDKDNNVVTYNETTVQSYIDANAYKDLRAKEYPSIADQLDTLYHSGLDAWKAQIKTVKDKYPKA